MIKVSLSQVKPVSNVLISAAAKHSANVLPGIAILSAALAPDTFMTSKNKEKQSDSPCAFYECTL